MSAKRNGQSDSDAAPLQKRAAAGAAAAAGDSDVDWQRRLAQRRVLIEHGKNTIGYNNYIKAVPREQRTERHMGTPDPTWGSKRRFDGVIKAWRRYLHSWDTVTTDSGGAPSLMDGTEDFTGELAAEAEAVSQELVAMAKQEAPTPASKPVSTAEAAMRSLDTILHDQQALDSALDFL